MKPYASIITVLIFISGAAIAQDQRAQLPGILSRSYIGLNMGYIDYPFSMDQLEPGYRAESVKVPHLAVQVLLFGYRINKMLSAEITYMRPVNWVEYRNVNKDNRVHWVWMNIGGLTVKSSVPVTKKLGVQMEGGLAIVTRKGFEINNQVVVRNAHYGSALFGGGLQYKLNNRWDAGIKVLYSPERKRSNQPHTIFYSTGFSYKLEPLPESIVRQNQSGYIFPKNIFQVGYTTNTLKYGVNDFLSKGAVPVFWGGDAEVAKGVTIQYLRNLYHGRKFFSFDIGASMSYWESRQQKNHFYTVSVFPVFRVTPIHSKLADIYFYYSVVGPAFISRPHIDDIDTGEVFTFQDLMGIGIFTGEKRNLNAEIRIGHFSNGNMFPENNGIKVPLTFNIGYCF